MSGPTLEIGALVVPYVVTLGLRVEYERLAARSDRRTAAGGLNRRTAWTGKLRATITGDGWAPPGLATLDEDTAYSVALPELRSVDSASNVITLPAARRSGGIYTPLGFAVVAGALVSTPVALVTDTATLTTVAGASGYRVDYYPQVSAYVRFVREELDAERRVHGWQLVVEEA